MSELSKQALLVDNNQSFPNNNAGAITPSILRAFNTNMIDSTVNQTVFDAFSSSVESEFASLTQSVDPSITGSSLITASISGQTMTFTKGDGTTFGLLIPDVSGSTLDTGSLMVTGSVSGNVLTFTKGDATTFNLTVATGSGATINTGSFATTGSNAFVGNQTINGAQFGTGASTGTSSIAIGVNTLPGNTGNANIAIGERAGQQMTTGGSNIGIGLDAIQRNQTGGQNVAVGEGALRENRTGNANTVIGHNAALNAGNVTGNTIVGRSATNFLKSNYNTIIGETAATNITSGSANTIVGQAAGADIGSGSQNTFIGQNAGRNISGSNNTFIGGAFGVGNENGVIALSDGAGNIRAQFINNEWDLTGSVDISGSLTASLAQGFTYVGNAAGRTTLVATSSFGGSLPAGVLSSSVTNFVDYSASVDTRINNIVTGTGFATTGSNTFTGKQTINEELLVNVPRASGKEFRVNWGSASSASMYTEDSGGPNQTLNLNSASLYLNRGGLFFPSGSFTSQVGDMQFNAFPSASFTIRTQQGGDAILRANTDYTDPNRPYSYFQASPNGQISIVGNGDGINITGSLGTTIQGLKYPSTDGTNGQVITTNGSGVLSFTTVSGGGGTTYENPTLNPYSGSLILVANTFTSGAANFAHISASAGNQVNLVFKSNNTTADTIISGSNNIFQNPAAPTAGFKRYLSSNNIAIGGGFPQISASMAYSPNIGNNYFAGTVTMRGPVSASLTQVTSTVLLGTINIGQGAVLNAEKLTGQTALSQNVVAGQLNLVANQSEIKALTNVTQNNINGFVVLNLSSSATIFSANTINDGNFTFTNQFSSGGIGFGQTAIGNNTIGGSGNTLIITGSQPTLAGQQANISNNILVGNANTIFVNSAESRFSGTTIYHQAAATGLIGNRLNVTGSSNISADTNSYGSVFVGRWNAVDGVRDRTSDIIFAVGTGTSGTRKTGFHIDSGSNTFVEGTFNVSGSSAFNGNVNITGSLLVNGATISTVGFATTGSNSFNGNQRITGSLTISGSIITVDRSGNDGNLYMGQNALGMGFAGAQPLAIGNSISVAIGNGAMRFASGSNQNVAIGNNALLVTTGSKNFALGSEALSSNTTGYSNIAIGVSALNKNTTGEYNTAIGDSAGFNLNGSYNVLIGQYSGNNITGSNNTILGSYQGVAGETINNNIILADGQGNIRAQYSGSSWNMEAPVNFTTGSNQQAGTAVLDGGNPGSATISNSLVTANSIIMLTKQTLTNSHMVAITAKSAGSFTITSNGNGDTDTVGWFIINNS